MTIIELAVVIHRYPAILVKIDFNKNYSDKMFCAQPHSLVWLMYVQKQNLRNIIEFRGIKKLSGFKGFTSDYRR